MRSTYQDQSLVRRSFTVSWAKDDGETIKAIVELLGKIVPDIDNPIEVNKISYMKVELEYTDVRE